MCALEEKKATSGRAPKVFLKRRSAAFYEEKRRIALISAGLSEAGDPPAPKKQKKTLLKAFEERSASFLY